MLVIAATEGLSVEAQRAESGGGVLVRGSQPPPHQLWDLGEHCKLPHWALEQSPSRN